MANGNTTMVRSVVTAIISASLISAGGAYVAVKVQERDIQQNAADVLVLETDIRDHRGESGQIDNRVTRLEANQRRQDENYARISNQLAKIQTDMNTLLRRPATRRPR